MKVLSTCYIHKECAFLNHASTAERMTAHYLHDLNKDKAVNTFREKDTQETFAGCRERELTLFELIDTI